MADDLYARMALELESFDSPDAALDTIAQYARVAVDADDAGLMLANGGKVSTPAGTSGPVTRAHELQAELGEGPCLAVMEGGDHPYLVHDTRDDQRWPRWCKAAAELGYFSVLSSSIETQSRRLGSLNVYARTAHAFADHDAETMKLLAAHAAVALSAITMRRELHKALASRRAIGQAQGILMRSFDIDSDRAFAYMQRLSQERNIKLFRIAEEIVHNRIELASGKGGTQP